MDLLHARSQMGKDLTSQSWVIKVSIFLCSLTAIFTSPILWTNLCFFALDDLRHLMAVKLELHTKFAEENEMSSFLLSAKSGDQIKQAFYKIATLLAGEVIIFLEMMLLNHIHSCTIFFIMWSVCCTRLLSRRSGFWKHIATRHSWVFHSPP